VETLIEYERYRDSRVRLWEVFVIQAGFSSRGVVLVIFIVLLVYWIISLLVCCFVLLNPFRVCATLDLKIEPCNHW